MALSCEVDESRSFHEQLLNAVGQAVIASNLDGKINYWNKAAEHMYGWSADEVLGRDIFEITASLDDRRHMIGEPGAGGSFSGEFLVQRRDGTGFPAHVTTTPIVDSEGAIIGLVGIHSDITVQKQTAEDLREREKLFRVVVESAPNGIMIVNPEGRIDLVNTEVERTFGYLRDDLIGMPVEKLVPMNARKAHANLRGSFVMEHQKRRLGMGRDLSALRADGSTFPAEIGLTPIETPQGMKV
jgi:PAS domain S-box-containing protein